MRFGRPLGSFSYVWTMTTTAPPGDRSPGRRLLRWIPVVFWCMVSIVLVSFASGSWLTAVVVIPCVLFAPGIVGVLLLDLRGAARVVTVVILVAVAAGVLVPSAFLYAGSWSPQNVFATIMTITILGASGGALADSGALAWIAAQARRACP